jgi:hypothetical protein
MTLECANTDNRQPPVNEDLTLQLETSEPESRSQGFETGCKVVPRHKANNETGSSQFPKEHRCGGLLRLPRFGL